MEVLSNMTGIVLNILVKSGDKVKERQEVVILESMKMEISVQSTAEGTVKEVKINIGDFVNEGDVLVVLE